MRAAAAVLMTSENVDAQSIRIGDHIRIGTRHYPVVDMRADWNGNRRSLILAGHAPVLVKSGEYRTVRRPVPVDASRGQR